MAIAPLLSPAINPPFSHHLLFHRLQRCVLVRLSCPRAIQPRPRCLARRFLNRRSGHLRLTLSEAQVSTRPQWDTAQDRWGILHLATKDPGVGAVKTSVLKTVGGSSIWRLKTWGGSREDPVGDCSRPRWETAQALGGRTAQNLSGTAQDHWGILLEALGREPRRP
ncbi:hypothetical protein B0H17DRAFT_1183216 [Mycena rosella]|uniref:Uncharacterized protein n=1 Tax=Mycena rosella TaxID=1033263 RepID=A0AAD7GBI9_MYCRO|nr:hypothetical protein B0H17DRAFT_1183216 [Mycena rosella]